MENRDLRLYRYGDGQLYKHHTFSKTSHMFKTYEECETTYIGLLNNSQKRRIKNNMEPFTKTSPPKNMQYAIIEYFGNYDSKIIKILNPEDYL